jgi:hypothetical protein
MTPEGPRATARTNRRLAKEIAAILSFASSVATFDVVDHLTSLISGLHGLKRKALSLAFSSRASDSAEKILAEEL